MEIYSHSRLNSFEQCPLKYKYKYIDKIITLEKSIEAFLGKIIHDSLEWLYIQITKNKTPTIDDVITHYASNWEKKYTPTIIIVKKDLTISDYFHKGIQFLLDYYIQHKPFDDNTLEVEKRIVINLDEKGEYKLQGFIDRLAHNLKKDEFEIHDYKTGNSLPTQEKIDNDRQLALYSIAIKELFGKEKEVLLIWHYLAHSTKIYSKRTNEQLQKLKDDTLILIKKIEATIEFPANKTMLCNWCEYRKICQEFNKKSKPQNLGNKKLDIWD